MSAVVLRRLVAALVAAGLGIGDGAAASARDGAAPEAPARPAPKNAAKGTQGSEPKQAPATGAAGSKETARGPAPGLLSVVPAVVPRDWRGQPIQHACTASRSELEGFKEALIRHEIFKIGSASKMATGWFYGGRLKSARLVMREKSGKAHADAITAFLKRESASLRTAAIVYDIGVDGNRQTLCIWLVTPDGMEAAETVALGAGSAIRIGTVAGQARDALGVTKVALARSPAARGAIQASAVSAAVAAREVARAASMDELSRLLLPASVQRALKARAVERLLVLPVADLATVPFSALTLGDRPLVEQASVVVLTDLLGLFNSLEAKLWRDRFDNARQQKLVVGDPDSTGDDLVWSVLQGAREEAEQVAAIAADIPGGTFVRGEAQKSAIEEVLKDEWLSLIYFATHGVADAADPLSNSYLLLAGGRLTANEIAGFRGGSLRLAPLVVMSACQSGLGKTFEGGTFGLARAWIFRGASQVVASLWDIGDVTTKDLMVDFMQRVLKERQRPEEALRAAMLAASKRGVPAAAWSGFSMVGYASE